MEYIVAGLLRAAIPFIIMTGIAIALKYGSGKANQAKSTFIVGLMITSLVGFSVIYNVESWSLQKQSIIHFVCMLIIIFPCLILSGWFKIKSALDILKILGIFIIWGIVFWGIFYFIFGILM